MKRLDRVLCLVLAILLCLPLVGAPVYASDELESEPAPASDGAAAEEAEAEARYGEGLAGSAAPDGEADNDALFAAYAETILYGAPLTDADAPARDGLAAGERLTGINKEIYDALCKCIADVAVGKEQSTVFTVALSGLTTGKTLWTAEEIESAGYSAALVNGNPSDEAVEYICASLEFDFDRVLACLLADCPFDLYWYDKTVELEYQYPGYMWWEGTGGFSQIGFDADQGAFLFRFPAAEGYAASEPYRVNENVNGAAVQAAAAKAAAIVADNKAKSDYEKLAAYKDAICVLAAYNDDAADPMKETPYGDPWQLIWVFDGDETTNVVCEGYAKAFRYLCDLSDFKTGVDCRTVTGLLRGEDTYEDHMWNIVKMEDGKNYLVDVTNCDADMAGYPDVLFLAGSDRQVSAQAGDPETGEMFWLPGYRFGAGGQTLDYYYGEGTLSLYTEAERTLADAKYAPLYGDAGVDQAVTAYDAALILQYAVGLPMDGVTFNAYAADANRDESVDARDAAVVLGMG